MITNQDVGANFKLSEQGTGEFVNNFDEVDAQLIQDLVANTGQTIFDTDIGTTIFYPELDAGVAPLDTDNDGMPDDWEETCGLDSNDPTDRNIITSNGYTNLENYLNGINCESLSVSSNNLTDQINIFPNPAADNLVIQKLTDEAMTASLTNLVGAIIQERIHMINQTTRLDLSQLVSGIYILSIEGASGAVQMKVIKN